jgi:hypothetical protein
MNKEKVIGALIIAGVSVFLIFTFPWIVLGIILFGVIFLAQIID